MRDIRAERAVQEDNRSIWLQNNDLNKIEEAAMSIKEGNKLPEAHNCTGYPSDNSSYHSRQREKLSRPIAAKEPSIIPLAAEITAADLPSKSAADSIELSARLIDIA